MSQSLERDPDLRPAVSIVEAEGDVTVIREVVLEDGLLEDRLLEDAAEPVGARSRRNLKLLTIAIACTDALSLVIAVGVSGIPVAAAAATGPQKALLGVSLVAMWLAVLAGFGLYTLERKRAGQQASRIVAAAGVMTAFAVVLAAGRLPFTGDVRLGPTLVVLICFELVTRSLWARSAAALRGRGVLGLRTLVIGASEESEDLAVVLSDGDSDLVPLGRVSVDGDPEMRDGLPHLGHVGSLGSVIRATDPDCLLVASRSIGRAELARIRRLARHAGLRLGVLTRAPEALASRLSVMPLGPLVAVGVRPAKLTGIQAALKRGFDVTGAVFALVLAAPLMLGVAAAVRMTSPGPILFRQERITRGGRPFTILKFRTMAHEVARMIEERSLDQTQPFFKPIDVELMTPVGGFLRRFSLDELPQLWNVIRGDMSLVGPRPLPAEQVAANPELLGPRHDVRAGITGWWQTNGRSEVSPEEAIRQDLFYIENWSLGLDLSIMMRTIGVLLHRRGAR